MRSRKGIALLDVAVALVFVSFVVVSLTPLFLAARRLSVRALQSLQGGRLALALASEVRLKRWDEDPAAPSAVLGTEAGENAGSKATFDDADDYDGWTESPPQDPLGTALTGTAGWTVTAAVVWVGPDLAEAAGPTALKRVTVRALFQGAERAKVTTLLPEP